MKQTEIDAIKVAFGSNVRRFRLAAKLSQLRLAQLSEVDVTFISKVERGLTNASLLSISRISKSLGVHPAKLFSPLAGFGELHVD